MKFIVNFIKDYIKSLRAKKTLVYTAMGNDNYFYIVKRLKSHGLKYWTKVHIDYRNGRDFTDTNYTIYDIYVREEDEAKAYKAMQRRND